MAKTACGRPAPRTTVVGTRLVSTTVASLTARRADPFEEAVAAVVGAIALGLGGEDPAVVADEAALLVGAVAAVGEAVALRRFFIQGVAEALTVLAVVYLALVWSLSAGMLRLETRLALPEER